MDKVFTLLGRSKSASNAAADLTRPLLLHLGALQAAMEDGKLGTMFRYANASQLSQLVARNKDAFERAAPALQGDRAFALVERYERGCEELISTLPELLEELWSSEEASAELLDEVLSGSAHLSRLASPAAAFAAPFAQTPDDAPTILAQALVDSPHAEAEVVMNAILGAHRELREIEEVKTVIANKLSPFFEALRGLSSLALEIENEAHDLASRWEKERRDKLLKILLIPAVCVFVLAMLFVIVLVISSMGGKSTPVVEPDVFTLEQVEQILGDDPDAKAWLAFASRHEETSFTGSIPTKRRESWGTSFTKSASDIHEATSSEAFCELVEEVRSLGIVMAHTDRVQPSCKELFRIRAEIERMQSEYRDALDAYHRDSARESEAIRELEEAREVLAYAQASSSYFSGYIHGRIGTSEALEVSRNAYGQRYALLTTQTVFETKGTFDMRVVSCGTYDVVLRNGRAAVWPCIKEADTSSITIADLAVQQAYEELRAARAANKAVKPSKPFLLGLENKADDIRARLKGIVAGISSQAREKPTSDKGSTTNTGEASNAQKSSPHLSLLCQTGANGSCKTCPVRSMFEDATPDTRITATRQLTPTLSLLEITDSECFHHTHAYRRVYAVDTDTTPRVVGSFDGAQARDCQLFGEALVCAVEFAGAGEAQGQVKALHLSTGAQQALVTYSDSFDYACSSKKVIAEGFSLGKLESVDKNQDGKLDLLIELERRFVRVPGKDADFCTIFEAGSFETEKSTHQVVLFQGQDGTFSSEDGRLPISASQWEPAWIEPTSWGRAQIDSLVRSLPESDEGWMLHMRRLSALRYRQKSKELEEMTRALVILYPDKKRYLFTTLARDCEEASAFDCAARAHESLVGMGVDELLLEAAWFYVTAKEQRDLLRARKLLGQVRNPEKYEPLYTRLRVELLLHGERFEEARAILEANAKDPILADKLARLDDPARRFEPSPRPSIPARPHKGPREWGDEVPAGSFDEDEIAIGLHFLATKYGRKGQFAQASAIYKSALARVRGDHAKVVIELGYGKLHERAGRHAEALYHYKALASKYPANDRVNNRLAWFLLTTKERQLRDVEGGYHFAKLAAMQTDQQDPSVLDTIAEAHAQRGEWEDAARLIERCQALDPSREYYNKRAEQMRLKKTTAMASR